MPMVSEMVEIEGQKMLDGGISDSIPIRFFESIGYEKNIAVLTQCKGFVKRKNPVMPLFSLLYRKYPSLIKTMAERHTVYNETLSYIEERERDGSLFVIRPETELPVSRVEKDPEKLKAAYEMGRSTALKNLEKIKAFLS